MALTDKLTAIADAIRAKTGKTSALTLPEMVDAITSIPMGVTNCIIASYTRTTAIANNPVTIISNNSFIASNYNNSKAFAFVVKVSNLQINGLQLVFNTNQQFGVLSSSDSTGVYGWYTTNTNNISNSGFRITQPLSSTSVNTNSIIATENGDLIVKPGNTTATLQTGDYFIIFGIMGTDS